MAPDFLDCLPEDYLVYMVSEWSDALELAAPQVQRGTGNLPYAHSMMVKILLYGYASGVWSPRHLAQKLEED